MDWKKVLHQHKLRMTPIRAAVLELIDVAPQPIDAITIHTRLKKNHIDCDLVTIYRMLESFVLCDIVTQIDFQDGKYRYEILHEHHHHLICTSCGFVQPIHEPCIAVSEQTVKEKYGFTISRHQLEFFGLCDKCVTLS